MSGKMQHRPAPDPTPRGEHCAHCIHGGKPPLRRLRPRVDRLVTDRFALGFRDHVIAEDSYRLRER